MTCTPQAPPAQRCGVGTLCSSPPAALVTRCRVSTRRWIQPLGQKTLCLGEKHHFLGIRDKTKQDPCAPLPPWQSPPLTIPNCNQGQKGPLKPAQLLAPKAPTSPCTRCQDESLEQGKAGGMQGVASHEVMLAEGDGARMLCIWTQAPCAPVPKIPPAGGVPMLLTETNPYARAGRPAGA